MTIALYLLALVNFLVGTGAIYLSLIESIPLKWHYHHYFVRKPLAWLGLGVSIGLCAWFDFSLSYLVPLALSSLGVILTYKMHQEAAFVAIDYPAMAENVDALPLQGETKMALINYQGVTKAYPLDYVIHHHIINDRFGDRIVSLTYCAMCRSIIPFDVTAIGPLFVAGFKNANMIVADRKTITYFQQSTFESELGPLHPMTLECLSFQILKWKDIKTLQQRPQVVQVTQRDFRDFELPIPGLWKKIISRNTTPGLSLKQRDQTYPLRTHVIGIKSLGTSDPLVFLKDELIKERHYHNDNYGFFLFAVNGEIVAFKDSFSGTMLDLSIEGDVIKDLNSDTCWDFAGSHIQGSLAKDLQLVSVSDEYWFSWKFFHPSSQLIHPQTR